MINVEDAESVEVGQVYMVNVVKVAKSEAYLVNDGVIVTRVPFVGPIMLPALGPLHDDQVFIPSFPENEPHWHIDHRFIPRAVYADVIDELRQNYAASCGTDADGPNFDLASVIRASDVEGEPQRRAMVCVRSHPPCWEATLWSWLPNLERAYQTQRACNNVCPHRQISLVGAPEDKNGVRVCPGHGLAWDKSGVLVPRASRVKQ